MADYYDEWDVQEPRYRQRSPGSAGSEGGRRRRRGGRPGGGYSYRRQHGGQWAGFEPERRDYGPGYRSQYVYEEDEPDEYEAGYDYEEEHGQWPGYEPVRRDYGRFHGRGYRREGAQFEEAYPSGGADEGRRGWRRRYGRDYPFPGDRKGQWRSVRQERPYSYTGERPPEYGYPTLQSGPEAGPHVGKGPKGYQRSDESMFEDACEALTEHGYLDAGDIEVSVEDAEITLEGTVEDRRSKRLAEDLAAAVRGVWDVHNRLHIPREDEEG